MPFLSAMAFLSSDYGAGCFKSGEKSVPIKVLIMVLLSYYFFAFLSTIYRYKNYICTCINNAVK